MVSIDKADGNIVIICKGFYMQVLIKELAIDNMLNAISTCDCLPNTNTEALIFYYSKFILKTFQQKLNEENQCLPLIY